MNDDGTMIRAPLFMREHMAIVRFVAVECEMQQSGEASVADMVAAWQFAMLVAEHSPRQVTAQSVVDLGKLIEPKKNARGFREVPVSVGGEMMLDWRLVPEQIEKLVVADALSPAEWFRYFEEVHPFVDGNGRVGQVCFNWLSGTLRTPRWAPNFWDDPRRVVGRGE